jgi:DNA-binding MarR family transcriptional regulator
MNAPKKYASGKDLHALFRELFALHAALAERIDATHETAGLGTPQAKVMDALLHFGAATVPQIAARHGVSRQFVQTVCNGLKVRDLVAFSENPRHRRSKLITLTPLGRKVFARFRRAEAAVIETHLRGFGATDVAAAARLLRTIHGRIESITR